MRRSRTLAALLALLLASSLPGAGPARGADDFDDALREGRVLEVERRLDADPSRVRTRFELGLTPLHLAVRSHRLDLVELLLDRGAPVNARSDSGRTPLHDAVLEPDLPILLCLVFAGADLGAVDRDGRTPLHWAARLQKTAMVTALVNRGAPLDLRDRQGRTPLDLARLVGPEEMVRLLERAAGAR